MADGTTKPIAEVKVGDEVVNTSPDGKKVEHHKVTAVHVTQDDHDRVNLLLAGGGEPIRTTEHHQIWEARSHHWVEAGQLQAGDLVQTLGHTVTIADVKRQSGSGITYDLTINTLHAYYVLTGTLSVLVHNCGASDLDPWQVVDRIEGHVKGLHSFGTGSSGSKFAADISDEDLINLVHDGVGGPITKTNADGLGHFHEWNAGRVTGTVDGHATTRVGVWINPGPNGTWLLGTIYPIK
jgi:hypothetical protein